MWKTVILSVQAANRLVIEAAPWAPLIAQVIFCPNFDIWKKKKKNNVLAKCFLVFRKCSTMTSATMLLSKRYVSPTLGKIFSYWWIAVRYKTYNTGKKKKNSTNLASTVGEFCCSVVCKGTSPSKGAPFAAAPASTFNVASCPSFAVSAFLGCPVLDWTVAQASGIWLPPLSTTRTSLRASGLQRMMGRLGADGQCGS